MSSHTRATFAAAATGVLVGAAMVSTKAVSLDVPPATLAFLRYLIGITVLVVPLACARRAGFATKDAIGIALLGVFQFAVLILLLNYALARLPASTCALVFASMPIFTMCLAIVFGREKCGLTELAGVVLAVAGVAYLLSVPSSHPVPQADVLPGYGALICATLTGAVTSILYGAYLARYPVLPTCSLAMGAAVVFLAGVCGLGSQPFIPPALTLVQWTHVGFIGLASGVGFLCWLGALAKLTPSRVAVFQALGPVTAAVIELLIARQLPSITLLISLAMVSAGLRLATRRKQLATVGPATSIADE